MDAYLVWLLIGFGLAIAELLTGTFYLLVLGVAGLGGALAAWLGYGFPLQAVTAGVVASLGTYGVHLFHVKNVKQAMKPLDHAQPVTFEEWVNQDAQIARVRYRGASWEAHVDGDATIVPGGMLYVLAADGNTLTVSKTRPA